MKKQAYLWGLFLAAVLFWGYSGQQPEVMGAAHFANDKDVSLTRVSSTPAPPKIPALEPLTPPASVLNEHNVTEMTLAAHWGKGIALAAVWNPGESGFALVSSAGVYLYTSRGELKKALETGQKYRCAAFSGDGALLAAGTETGQIHLWRMQDLDDMRSFSAQSLPLLALAFSADGAWLASASWDASVNIWQTADLVGGTDQPNQAYRTFRAKDNTAALAGYAGALSFDANSKTLWVWEKSGVVRIWDVLNASQLDPIASSGASVAAFSTDGSLLALADKEQVRVFRTDNGYTRYRLDLPQSAAPVAGLAFSAGLLAASQGQTVFIWRLSDGSLVQTLALTGAAARAGAMAFAPDASTLVLAGDALRTWQLNSTGLLGEVRLEEPANRVVLSPSGESLLAWNDASIKVTLGGKNSGDLAGHAASPQDAVFSPDGAWLATAADRLRIWDARTHSLLAEREAPAQDIQAQYRLRVYDPESGQTNFTLLEGIVPLTSLAVSPDGVLLAAGGADGRIYLWRMPEAAPLGVFEIPPEQAGKIFAQKMAFSEDGLFLAAAFGAADFSATRALVWQFSGSLTHEVQLLLNIPLANQNPGSFCALALQPAAGELLVAWQQFSQRFSLQDGALKSEENSLCGCSDSVSQNGAVWREQQDARVFLQPPANFPRLETAVCSLQNEQTQQITLGWSGGGGVVYRSWQFNHAQPVLALVDASFSPSREAVMDFWLDENAVQLVRADGASQRFDWQTGQVFRSAPPGGLPAFDSVSLSAQGWMAAASPRRVSLWQMQDNQVKVLNIGGASVTALNADGSLLAVAFGNLVRVYHLPELQLVFTFTEGMSSDVLELKFAGNAGLLMARTRTLVYLWDVSTPQGEAVLLQSYEGYAGALSSDGSLLAVAHVLPQGHSVQVWRTADSVRVAQLPGGGSRMAFSPDSSLLAVSGIRLSLWQIKTQDLLITLPTPAPYSRIAFSQEGFWFATISWDGIIHLWGLMQ